MEILFIRPRKKTRWKWEKKRKGKLNFFSAIFWVKSSWFSSIAGRKQWPPTFRGSCCAETLFRGDGYQNLLKTFEFGGKKKSGGGVSKALRKLGEKMVETVPEMPPRCPDSDFRKLAQKGAWSIPISARL